MDLLTTAFNRKHGTIEFKKAFNEFEKNGNSPAIMMFDIDNFKHVNDTFGHAAGDQVLKDIINVVSNNKKRMELTCKLEVNSSDAIWKTNIRTRRKTI